MLSPHRWQLQVASLFMLADCVSRLRLYFALPFSSSVLAQVGRAPFRHRQTARITDVLSI